MNSKLIHNCLWTDDLLGMTFCLGLNHRMLSPKYYNPPMWKKITFYYFCCLIKITKYKQKRGTLGYVKGTRTSISNCTAGQNREMKKPTLATSHVVQSIGFRVGDLGSVPAPLLTNCMT